MWIYGIQWRSVSAIRNSVTATHLATWLMATWIGLCVSILGMSDSNQRQCLPQTKDDCRRHAGAVMSVMVIVQRHSTTVLESDIITRATHIHPTQSPSPMCYLNCYSELQAPTQGSWSTKLLGANFELLK